MIRPLLKSDRTSLEKLVSEQPLFSKEEIEVAMELIDIAIDNPAQKDYNIFVYTEDENILGYHCTGKRPLTKGTFDLYWIAVDVNYAGKGIGKKLIEHAKAFVLQSNGSLLLAETSSKESYKDTQNFYNKTGFELLADIKNFYSEGDSLLMYGVYF